MNFLEALEEFRQQKKPGALCTVVANSGSTPRKLGAKMLVITNGSEHGRIVGTIGGGAIEHHIRLKAIEAIREEKPLLVTTSLRNDLGMCCGGEMTVFVEPLVASSTLLLFGAGHIAQALCPIAEALDFAISVVDHRKELLDSLCFKSCDKLCEVITPFSFADLPFGHKSFVVIATHDHALDQRIIEQALEHDFKYLALVGSKRKALMTQKRLQAKGISPALQAKIICPAGLSINAQTPAEIALSIAAQMIQVQNA
ncbi:MAG TPA: XdhC family protein [Myxococcota bacterium]|nr:XdhC family protein [Myxococcota bacterium]